MILVICSREKNAATEVSRTKTQTPTVAKPNKKTRTVFDLRHTGRKLHVCQIPISATKKGAIGP